MTCFQRVNSSKAALCAFMLLALAPGIVLGQVPDTAKYPTTNLDVVELNVLGKKYSNLPFETRLQQLEHSLNSQPAPTDSYNYRISRIFSVQQSRISQENKQAAVRLYNRAVDEATQGNTDTAIATYKSALELNPFMVEAHNNLANLQEKKHLYADAADTYRQALALSPQDAVLHFNLAVILEKQGKVVDAYEHYREYVKLSPSPKPQIVELIRNFDAKHLASKNTPDYYTLVTQESNGERLAWPEAQIPIPVYIGLTDPSQAVFIRNIYQGFDTWSTVTNHILKFREVGYPDQAKIIITLKQGPLMDPNASIGHANFNSASLYQEDPMRALRVSIVINTGEPDNDLSLENRQEQVSKLVLHELGHAIGIWGHSKDPTDIMYTHPIVSQLSPRDINTVRKLYKIR